MKTVVDLFKWVLERDFRAKNATSFLLALLSVIVFYSSSRHRASFKGLQDSDDTGVAVALLIVFLTVFFGVWLIYSIAETFCRRVLSQQRVRERAEHEKMAIRRDLESLSEWQRKFVLRFLVEGKMQMHEYEIGGYKGVWGPEIDVLVNKRIVKHHPREGVYEIESCYYDYVRQNFSPETGESA